MDVGRNPSKSTQLRHKSSKKQRSCFIKIHTNSLNFHKHNKRGSPLDVDENQQTPDAFWQTSTNTSGSFLFKHNKRQLDVYKLQQNQPDFDNNRKHKTPDPYQNQQRSVRNCKQMWKSLTGFWWTSTNATGGAQNPQNTAGLKKQLKQQTSAGCLRTSTETYIFHIYQQTIDGFWQASTKISRISPQVTKTQTAFYQNPHKAIAISQNIRANQLSFDETHKATRGVCPKIHKIQRTCFFKKQHTSTGCLQNSIQINRSSIKNQTINQRFIKKSLSFELEIAIRGEH